MTSTVAVFAAVVASVAVSHATFEAIARFAETRLGAYLWKGQDQLRLLEGHLHVGQGATRLALFGPSEVREGLLPDELQRVTPGLRPYQAGQSNGTLADTWLSVDYVERVHGPSARPAHMVLGVTPRFIANIRVGASPLVDSLRKYGAYDVDTTSGAPTLVSRSALGALAGRLRLLALQPDRYRRGLVALALAMLHPVAPESSEQFARRWLHPAKYLTGRAGTTESDLEWLEVDPGWQSVFAWDPARDHDRIVGEIGRLAAYCVRHDVKLYVVNLPEWSGTRTRYVPGRYEAYLSAVRAGIGDTPFLDLRTFLNDDEIWDTAHPNWTGAIRLSREVGEFIERHRAQGLAQAVAR